MSDEAAGVLAANAEFYAAFEATDLDRMSAVWDEADDISCIHPGWQQLVGRSHVLRSWAVIFANTPYIQFVLTDVAAVASGDLAVVTCAENILTTDDLASGSTVIATNVFRRTPDGWRMSRHHGSPVMRVLAEDEDPED